MAGNESIQDWDSVWPFGRNSFRIECFQIISIQYVKDRYKIPKPFPILSNNSIRSFTIEHAECWRLNLLNASLCLSLDNWNKLTQGLSPSGMIWPALTLKPARWDSSFHLVYIPPNIFQQCRGRDNKNHLHNIYVILSWPLSRTTWAQLVTLSVSHWLFPCEYWSL